MSVPSTSLITQLEGKPIPGGGNTSGGTFHRLTPQSSGTGAQVVVAPAPANVINVLPLGSSITEGISAAPAYAGGGYRSQLYQSLVNDGRFSPDFESSNTVLDNATPGGYNVLSGANPFHHEGHGGYVTAQILHNLNGNDGARRNDGGYWLAPDNGVNPESVSINNHQVWGNVSSHDFTVTGNISGGYGLTLTNAYTIQVPVATDHRGPVRAPGGSSSPATTPTAAARR